MRSPLFVLFLALATSASVQAQPAFSKAFSPTEVGPGSQTTLAFEIDNTDGPVVATGLAFTDVLPAGQVIATPAQATTTCQGDRDGNPPTLSAPNGGSTITLSGASVPAGQTCNVRVNVQGTATGTNVSGALTSSAGNSGTASATLTVATNRPGFSKSFSPSTVALGGRSRLTFTIDNTANASGVTAANFTDNLPGGLTVASPANVARTCGVGGTAQPITATPGSSQISFNAFGADVEGFRIVNAGASCTISVDVEAGLTGALGNTSESLSATVSGQPRVSGKAGAVLTVTGAGGLVFTKDFIDDPVAPGQATTLRFRIVNTDRNNAATNIAFTDDLDATLAGLAATDTPLSGVCGVGSVLAGTDLLSLTGGTLAPEASCTFTTTLQVPTGATPGQYTNTTSTITADLGGSPIVGAPATSDLFVSAAPVLTKTFLDNPAVPGETVSLQFDIANASSTDDATEIAFTDVIGEFAGAPASVTLPASGFCGAGSSIFLSNSSSEGPTLFISNASLAAGGSCSFTVDIDLPLALGGGAYTNVTSEITAMVGGESVTGAPATDVLFVAQAPTLTKSFVGNPAVPGGTIGLEFTLTYDPEADGDATAITFSDDLEAVLAGLTPTDTPQTGVCGVGSTLSFSGGVLELAGGSLSPGESCTFTTSLQVPSAAVSGTYTNTTSPVQATVGGSALTTAPASDDLFVSAVLFSKEFTDDPVMPGETVRLRFRIENTDATQTAGDIFFTDNLSNTLSGLTFASEVLNQCGGTLTGTTFLTYFGGSLGAGETCLVEVDLAVPAGASDGTYSNLATGQYSLGGASLALPQAQDDLIITIDQAPLFSGVFVPETIVPDGVSTLTLTIDNSASSTAATGLDVSGTLPSGLTLATPASASTTCIGGTLTATDGGTTYSYSGGTVDPGVSCDLTFDVTGNTPGTFTTTTGDLTSSLGNSGPASADLRVAAVLFSLAFDPDSVLPGGTTELSFTIENGSDTDTYTDLAFTDDLDAVLSGLAAIDTPQSDVCGTGSQLTGTTVLSLSGGTLAPGSSCTFSATLQVPVDATAGVYPNVTSDLSGRVGGSAVAFGPASGDLTVVFDPPGFAKAFGPETIPAGGLSTLTLTIDNTGSDVPATGLSVTDDLPAGMTVAATPNASTTCTGGTLTADAGAGTISYDGGAVAAASTCTITVDVTAFDFGEYVNTTGDLTSSLGNSGTASATLTVIETPPGFAKAFEPETITQGGISTLTLTIDNTEGTVQASDLAVTDDLPAGMTVAATPNASTTCTGGTLTADAGSGTVSYAGGSLAAGSTCMISVDVTASAIDEYVNTAGDLTSSLGNSGTASATLTVIAAPPAFAKAFVPSTIAQGGVSTLTLTIDNSAASVPAEELAVTDELPAGMTVAPTPNATATCAGGTVTAEAGAGTISYADGTVPAGETCVISVDVTSSTLGPATNTTGDLTSTLGNSGPASAILTVEVPVLTATKRAILIDRDNPSTADPRETIRYIVQVSVNDVPSVPDVVFTDILGPYSALRVGSVTTSVGTVTSGNSPGDTSVSVDLGTLTPASGTIRIAFNTVVVDDVPESVAAICNQGDLTGGFPAVVTDDPSTTAPSDPTCTPATQPSVNIDVQSVEASRGGPVEVTGSLTNTTPTPVRFRVHAALRTPDAQTLTSVSQRVLLQGGQSRGPRTAMIGDLTIPAGAPDGTYRLTLEAITVNTGAVLDTDVIEFMLADGVAVAVTGDASEAPSAAGPATASLSAEELAAIVPGAGPNPFSGRTVLRYGVPEAAVVDLRVFDIRGRLVTVLQSGPVTSGVQEVVFDASAQPVGVYIWRLSVDGDVTTGRVTHVR